MKRTVLILAIPIILLFAILLALPALAQDNGCDGIECNKTATPTVTPSPSPTVKVCDQQGNCKTATPSPTIRVCTQDGNCHTATPSPTAVASQTPTNTPTNIPTNTPTNIPTVVITPREEPTPTPSTYTMYLPIVTYQEYVCRYDNMGAAWMYRTKMPFYLRDAFCIDSGWTGTYRLLSQENVESGLVPILWDDTALEFERFTDINYEGWVYVLNEPDLVGQADMTPQESADYIYLVEQSLPETVQLIWWNGNYLPHLAETLEIYYQAHQNIPRGIVGLHGYPIANPNGGYYLDIDRFINDACDIIANYSTADCRVVISEIGVCSAFPEAEDIMNYLLPYVTEDPRIEHTYWFTHYPDSPSNWDTRCNSRFWVELDPPTLPYFEYDATVGGRVLWEYIHGTEFPPYGLPEPYNMEK